MTICLARPPREHTHYVTTNKEPDWVQVFFADKTVFQLGTHKHVVRAKAGKEAPLEIVVLPSQIH